MLEVARVAVSKAKKGDNTMIKLLMELFVSKATPLEVQDSQVNKITLNVRTLELGEPKVTTETPETTKESLQ